MLEIAVGKYNASSCNTKRDSAFSTTDVLADWRQRRIDLAKDEIDSLAGLDSLFAHGGPEPTKAETRRSIERIVEKAASNGAPAWYVSELSDMLLKEHSDCFRLLLGLDCPALVQPMVIKIKPGAKFPKLAKRFYGAAQTKFLDYQIPRMLRNGILIRSLSAYGCPPYIPWSNKMTSSSSGKNAGKLRFCVDARAQNKITVIQRPASVPDINHMISKLAGMRVFCTLDGTEGFFSMPHSP